MEEQKTRKPNRLQEYDYAQPGAYFITICTQNRRSILSQISVGATCGRPDSVILMDAGKMVERELYRIGEIYENVAVDSYVIMPNHIHMILHIREDGGRPQVAPTVDGGTAGDHRSPLRGNGQDGRPMVVPTVKENGLPRQAAACLAMTGGMGVCTVGAAFGGPGTRRQGALKRSGAQRPRAVGVAQEGIVHRAVGGALFFLGPARPILSFRQDEKKEWGVHRLFFGHACGADPSVACGDTSPCRGGMPLRRLRRHLPLQGRQTPPSPAATPPLAGEAGTGGGVIRRFFISSLGQRLHSCISPCLRAADCRPCGKRTFPCAGAPLPEALSAAPP
jgi:REP element-mobilizing transposase RayT